MSEHLRNDDDIQNVKPPSPSLVLSLPPALSLIIPQVVRNVAEWNKVVEAIGQHAVSAAASGHPNQSILPPVSGHFVPLATTGMHESSREKEVTSCVAASVPRTIAHCGLERARSLYVSQCPPVLLCVCPTYERDGSKTFVAAHACSSNVTCYM